MGNNANVIARLSEAKALIAECLTLLGTSPAAPAKPSTKRSSGTGTSIDFGVPLRAFMKKHAKGLSGPNKFTLLLARLANGDESQSIALASVSKEWSKMTSILDGPFNRFYSSQAREHDWVNTTKAGAYHLRPNWQRTLE